MIAPGIKDHPFKTTMRSTRATSNRPNAYAAWVLILFVLLCGANALATTIVVIRTPVDVSIAADSAGTFGKEIRSVCKIYRMGNVFLGVAGIDNDAITQFRVSDIVSTAIRGQKTFAEKMNAATKALHPRLLAEAVFLRNNQPQAFADLVNPDNGGLAIVLIGMQDGLSFAITQSFVVAVNSQQNVDVIPNERKQCPGADCPNNIYAMYLGAKAAILRYTATNRLNITDSAAASRQFVQLEIDDRAPGVRGPIDVLRLSIFGPLWIQQKAGCPIEPKVSTAPGGKNGRGR